MAEGRAAAAEGRELKKQLGGKEAEAKEPKQRTEGVVSVSPFPITDIVRTAAAAVISPTRLGTIRKVVSRMLVILSSCLLAWLPH